MFVYWCSKKMPPERGQNHRRHQGFTLIEALVVVAIAGIVVSMAIPNFNTAIQNSRVKSESNGLLGAIAYTRTEAIRRGNNVHFSRRNGADWEGGFVAWIDANNNNTWNTGEEIRLWEPLHSSMSLSSGNGRTQFIFNASGMVDNDDELTLCDNRSGESGRELTLLISGLAILSEVTCS